MRQLLFFITLLPLASSAQNENLKHDKVWLFGYLGGSISPNDSTFGISRLEFLEDSLKITNNQEIEIFFEDTNASICDAQGNLLFYFNGVYIEDSTYQIMPGGDTLNEYNFSGYDLPQGGLILPLPDSVDKYVLFHSREEFYPPPEIVGCSGVFYSIIDISENNGKGVVSLRKEPLVIDRLQYGQLTGTRHANGRDWWLIVHEYGTNNFNIILLDPFGPNIEKEIVLGDTLSTGFGQAVFSPNGNRYAVLNSIGPGIGRFIDIYDFDRCTGGLTNHYRIHEPQNNGLGIAISPNSKYLYLSARTELFQYNLWSSDIESSRITIGVYDGYQSPPGFSTRFDMIQLAPDGKLYINCPGGNDVLHVIHNPDELGLACNFEQHAIKLPTHNSSSMPNFPNFRLGVLEGSPCDSLPPLARFAYDTTDLQVNFRDQSQRRILSWEWDFGDGTTSNEQHPEKEYSNSGGYKVCLTVSNNNGIDSTCQYIQFDTLPPLAAFTYTTNELQATFRDQSQRRILSWEWDFGDGTTINEQHPEKEYSNSGGYEVCLTVSNDNGADSTCQEVQVLKTTLDFLEQINFEFTIFPNPSQGQITIRTKESTRGKIQIHNSLGHLVYQMEVETEIPVINLPAGLYYCTLFSENGKSDAQKFVIFE